MCWWDVGSTLLVPYSGCWWPIWNHQHNKKVANISEISHHQKVTNITMSPTSLSTISDRFPDKSFTWISIISFCNFRRVLDWFHKFFDNLNLTLLIGEENCRIVYRNVWVSQSHSIPDSKALKYKSWNFQGSITKTHHGNGILRQVSV